MKNRALLFTFLLLLFLAGGYYTYTYLLKSNSIDYWDFVPPTAVAVYQGSNCVDCVDSIKNTAWVSLFKRKLEASAMMDTALVSILQDLSKKSILISVHRTTKNDFDFIFYTKSSVLKEGIHAVQKKDRAFNGLTIHETAYGKASIAWMENNMYTAWSLSSLLVEDVIRAVNDETSGSFRNSVGDVVGLPTVKKDAGEILLNFQEFKQWIDGFGVDSSIEFPLLGKGSLLDVKRVNDALVLTGFSAVDSTNRQSLLSVFEEQAPVSFNFKRFVSNEAQYVIDFGFSNTKLLGEKLQSRLNDLDRNSLLKKLTLSKEDLLKLYDEMGQEVAVVSVETLAGQSATVLMIDVKGSGNWMQALDKIATNTSTDTVFVEQFSAYSIKKIPVGGFLELVFPILSKKYTELYYVQVGNAFMLSEDLHALKIMLEDFDQENTWGKSVEKNRFLESTLLESNISLFVDPARCTKIIVDALHPDWKSLYIANNSLISLLGLSAMQFSFLNHNFYTNVHLTFLKESTSKPVKADREVIVSLASGIVSQAFVVRNHTDKSQEVVIQDSSQQVYLINTRGEILWQKKLDGYIKGHVQQIDYFANGKLQLLILTDKSIHVIDRLGNTVTPFPISLSFVNETVRVVDYDHSKKYRFLLADKQGVLRMMDKRGDLLEGWQGLKSSGELVATPKHFRISAKDYIAVLQKQGNFILYNRRGELQNNFPIDLKGRPSGDYYLDESNRQGKVGFVFINSDGYRVKVALSGEELSREALVKSSQETRFWLVCEENEKSYVVVRQDAKSLTILSDKLEAVVVNEFVGLNKTEIRYFDFGTGKIYYTLLDLEQNQGYIYDSRGALLTPQPIECDHLSLMRSQGKLWLITTLDSQLRMRLLE